MANLPMFLVDFTCFSPPDELLVNYHDNKEAVWKWEACTPEKHHFVGKIFLASGISHTRTALPRCLLPVHVDEFKTDYKSARVEAEQVLYQVIENVLEKTGIKPEQVDILISSCSIYCPTPSIASMIINKFKMREDIQAYHMGGMGCAMGVVGLCLARDLLIAHPGKICLFVSTEIVTAAFYPGLRKEALVTNALFRMGGSGCILTNNPLWRSRSKYQLQHALRVHTGASDRAYNALCWEPDDEGINGMVITKALPSEAAAILEKGVRKMTPRIMTWGQYGEAALHYVQQGLATVTGGKQLPPYQPDYTRCAEHFLLHAGGYAILRGIQAGLRLPAEKMMPSFVSLRDFGNTSSATTWYTWSYIEATMGIAKGERVLQVGVGGGMKSGVAFWRAVRDVRDRHPCWEHLGGKPIAEADLPRPISNEYKSIFKMGTAANGNAGQEPQPQANGHSHADKQQAKAAPMSCGMSKVDAAETIRLHVQSAMQEQVEEDEYAAA